MYEDPPTYTQILTEIAAKPLTKMERGLLALGLLTSGRITELIQCRAHNIKLYDLNGAEISSGSLDVLSKTPAASLYKGLDPKNISRIEVTLKNEKSKTKKLKKIPCLNVAEFEIPINWLVQRLQELPDPIYEDRIYGKNRTQGWFVMKSVNPQWTTHYMRHWGVSNDVRHGLNPAIIQKKTGWVDLKMLSRYTHLNSDDMVIAMETSWGKRPVPKVVPAPAPVIKEMAPKPAWIAPGARPYVPQKSMRKFDRQGHLIITKEMKDAENMLVSVV